MMCLSAVGKVYFAEFLEGVFCRIFVAESSANYIFDSFSAFCKIQIRSNHQLSVGLGSHLSLELTQ